MKLVIEVQVIEIQRLKISDSGSAFTLHCQLAKFRILREHSEVLKTLPVKLPKFNTFLVLRVCLNFVGQQTRHVQRKRAIEARVRDAIGMVMMRDGLHRQVRKSPQSEQIGADLGM